MRGRWNGGAVCAGGEHDCSRQNRDRVLPVVGDVVGCTAKSSHSEGSVEALSMYLHGGEHKNLAAEVCGSADGERKAVQVEVPSEAVGIRRVRIGHQPSPRVLHIDSPQTGIHYRGCGYGYGYGYGDLDDSGHSGGYKITSVRQQSTNNSN